MKSVSSKLLIDSLNGITRSGCQFFFYFFFQAGVGEMRLTFGNGVENQFLNWPSKLIYAM